ncbi:helix-turn-helix domain-containing protein [Kribbella sp. NPDC004875]|uniref:helix-turn-helix domain-containing protein n=1 Tax=Kribbella sp. NPDC004875 TaxID=3364107 RepID=UPI00367BFFA3
MPGAEHGTTGYANRPVHPALRQYVDDVIGYSSDAPPPELHRGLPSRHLTIVVTLDEPLGIRWPGGPLQKHDALIGGLHSTAVVIAGTASCAGVQLALTPAAARTLFGLPPGELGSMVVNLDELLGRRAAQLTDQLRETPTWSQRFDLLEGLLLRRLQDRRPATVRPELGWAWLRLCESNGAVGVQELASEVGWSRRHLTDRFVTEFGLAPKVAARILRFERVTAHLRRQPRPRLVDVAAAAGFADQSHLTREFQAIAGCSPRRWMAEELPNLPVNPSGNPQAAAIVPASSAGSH